MFNATNTHMYKPCFNLLSIISKLVKNLQM